MISKEDGGMGRRSCFLSVSDFFFLFVWGVFVWWLFRGGFGVWTQCRVAQWHLWGGDVTEKRCFIYRCHPPRCVRSWVGAGGQKRTFYWWRLPWTGVAGEKKLLVNSCAWHIDTWLNISFLRSMGEGGGLGDLSQIKQPHVADFFLCTPGTLQLISNLCRIAKKKFSCLYLLVSAEGRDPSSSLHLFRHVRWVSFHYDRYSCYW